MKNLSIKDMCVCAAVAAIYVVLTWVLIPYNNSGVFPFRISEALVLICFYNKKYIGPLTIACAIGNILSSLGFIDVVFGSLASLCALFLMSKCKNIFIAALMPVIFSVVIVIEIAVLWTEPEGFWATCVVWAPSIIGGQFVTTFIMGIPLFKLLEKNCKFMELIDANQNYSPVDIKETANEREEIK